MKGDELNVIRGCNQPYLPQLPSGGVATSAGVRELPWTGSAPGYGSAGCLARDMVREYPGSHELPTLIVRSHEGRLVLPTSETQWGDDAA
jgi:hypothetical protein